MMSAMIEAGGTPTGDGNKPRNPLGHIGTVEHIATFLSFEDLKNARLINRFWFRMTRSAWSKKSQIVLKDIAQVRDFVTATNSFPRPMAVPLSVHNWTFQEDSVFRLMCNDGHCEKQILEPFWPSIQHCTFSDWLKKLWRYERYVPDPENAPERQEIRRVHYYETKMRASTCHILEMVKICTNLSTLVIHFPILLSIKGAYNMGPRQFPELERLRRFEIYNEGHQFNNSLVAANFRELLNLHIITAAEEVIIPNDVNLMAGEVFVQRLLECSPNLTYFSVNSGTMISTQMERWASNILAKKNNPFPLAPKLTDLVISVPLTETICGGLQLKEWKLRSLHLRTIPGAEYYVTPMDLHRLILNFAETLEHLEIVFLSQDSGDFRSSRSLFMLKSIELWGFEGCYSFLKDFRKLRSAILGATEDDGSFERAKEYFEMNPLVNVDVQVLSQVDFFQRLNEGPKLPNNVY